MTSSSLTSQLTMLHHCLTNPVDSWISTNGFVHWINHDHLVIQVGRILTYPVGIQHSESTCQSPSSFFRFRTSAALEFNLVDTLTFWLTVSCTLGDRLLTSTTSKANSVDDVTLLSSVSQSSCFVRACGSRSTMDGGKMAELPASDSE